MPRGAAEALHARRRRKKAAEGRCFGRVLDACVSGGGAGAAQSRKA